MRKIITTLFLVFIMLFSITGVSSAANWRWITSTADTTYSFDTTSIIDKSYKISNTEYANFVYSVWVKYEYTDSKGEDMAKELSFNKPVGYALNELEFDYKNNGVRIKAMHVYGKDGTHLSSVPSYAFSSSFESIIPETTGEAIYKTTFKEYKTQYGKK